jgi:hypothetical protein
MERSGVDLEGHFDGYGFGMSWFTGYVKDLERLDIRIDLKEKRTQHQVYP